MFIDDKVGSILKPGFTGTITNAEKTEAYRTRGAPKEVSVLKP